MSLDHVSAVFKVGMEVTGANRMVLIVLANRANQDDIAYPKVSLIAKESGISRTRTVTDALTWLEENGWIERKINAWAGISGQIPEGKRPNVYKVKVAQRVSDADRGGVSVSDRRGVSDTDTQNHQLNHQEKTNNVIDETDDQPRLSNPPTPQGGPSSSSSPKRRKKQNAATILKPLDAEVFEAWWSFYPVKKRKADAMASWANALEAGVSTDVLEAALQHYVASIDDWEARAGQKLKFLFAAPRFIDGEYMDFVDGPDPDRWKQPDQAETDRPVEWTAWEQPTWSGEPDYDDE